MRLRPLSLRLIFLVAAALGGLRAARADDSPRPAASQGGQPPPPRVPIEIQIDKSKVDLREHHLELKASRALAKITLKVTGESGNVLASEAYEFTDQRAGAPLVVGWSPLNDEPVARIEVWVYDTDGFYKGVALTPWSVSIPHEEVNFKTGSAQIEESEKPKLEASYAKIADALAKHGDLKITLFVAGHTDTVGPAGYNLGLSRQRAQAIARWFRQRGLAAPVAYEGFGESALLVKTADEVDEPRNRRVDYILAVDEPFLRSTGFRPAWARVP